MEGKDKTETIVLSRYVKISNPRPVNVRTGKFSIPIWAFNRYQKKDFVFDGVIDGKEVVKVLDREYVKNHTTLVRKKHEHIEPNTLETVVTYQHFYLIKAKDIINYGA
jgi:hypothetical protein